MDISNYYLTNNRTGKTHALLQLESSFVSKDGELQPTVIARMYVFTPALTHTELYSLNYEDNNKLPDADNSPTISKISSKLAYASYKGYRLYDFVNLIEHYDDFDGDESMGMNKFIAHLFNDYISPEYLERLGATSFVYRYEEHIVNMEPFFIGYDRSEYLKLYTSL